MAGLADGMSLALSLAHGPRSAGSLRTEKTGARVDARWIALFWDALKRTCAVLNVYGH
jgi:hypothetical protein